MTEPAPECRWIHVTRFHGRWISRASWYVGPVRYTRRGEGSTYEEAYNAVAVYDIVILS